MRFGGEGIGISSRSSLGLLMTAVTVGGAAQGGPDPDGGTDSGQSDDGGRNVRIS